MQRRRDNILAALLNVRPKAEVERMIKCEICGGTENVETFSTSIDFIRHNICRKCACMSEEELEKLPEEKRFGIVVLQVLMETDDD